MRRHLFASLACLLLTVPIVARGQQATTTTSDSVAMLIGPRTLLIGRVNLDDVGVIKNMRQIQDELLGSGLFKQDIMPMKIDRVIDALAALRQAGAHEMFFSLVFGLDIANIEQLALVAAIPLQDVTRCDEIGKSLRTLVNITPLNKTKLQNVQLGQMMFAGPRKAIERLRLAATREPTDSRQRESLATAMAVVDDAAVQLFIVPTGDQRRVLSEMLPDLPSELGGVSLGALWSKIQWAAIGLELGDVRSLRVIAQADDAQGATVAVGEMKHLFELFGENQPLQEYVPLPQLGRILKRLSPTVQDDQVIMVVDDDGLKELSATVLAPAIAASREASRRMTMTTSIKEFGIAFHNFYAASKEKRFPDTAIHDAQGKPLLSWRVHVLPYLDGNGEELYQQFHLDEAWDSPHNRQLIKKMPRVFAIPGSPSSQEKERHVFKCPLVPTRSFPRGVGYR